MKKTILAFLFLFSILNANTNDEFQEYMKQNYKSNLNSTQEDGKNDFKNFKEKKLNEKKSEVEEYSKYKEEQLKEFEQYKKVLKEEFKKYAKEINEKWNEIKISSKTEFVEYSKDLTIRKSVDFDKGFIEVDIIVDKNENEKESRKKLENQILNLVVEDTQKAYENDTLEQRIKKEIKKQKIEIEDGKIESKPIITDFYAKNPEKGISKREEKKIIRNIKKEIKDVEIKVNKSKEKDKKVISIKLPLPSDGIIKKAKQYKKYVSKNSQENKIDETLIFAIMHSESSFNPMAKSYVPAYGLMQIVPRSAGKDVTKRMYGKAKMLSSSYLFNGSNNIKIGSYYLRVVYYNYMKNIKNPQSRLYCTIAAYNTGAGNVAKAFIGNYNITKASATINKMSSQEVYNHLMKNLPYDETKKYLKKVSERIKMYEVAIKQGKI